MTILFVIDALGGGGFERRMSQLILGLWKNHPEFSIKILVPANAQIVYDEILSCPEHIVSFNDTKEFKNKLREINPDIVHNCSPKLSLQICLLNAKHKFIHIAAYVADANRRFFLSKHQLGFSLCFPFVDAIISNTAAGLEAYRCPQKKSYVIPNGYDPVRSLIPMDEDLKSLCDNFAFVINMVAAMRSHKDYFSYINLAEKFKNKNVLFLACGTGPTEQAVKEYAEKKQLSNFKFLGFRKDVINIFKLSDISILFSSIGGHKEGLSNSILESMAVGTPVLATNDGGTVEIILDKIDGWLVDNNDLVYSESLINCLMENKEKLRNASHNAHEKITKVYTLDAMVEKYAKLYNKLLSSKR